MAIRTARSSFWKVAIPAEAGIHWLAYRVVAAWIPACAGMAYQMTRSRARLPAKDALAARRSGLAEAEFFEGCGHAQPIVRWHDNGHRHQPRLHLRDQGAEDAVTAMLGSDAASDVMPSGVEGVAQPIHQLVLIAMGVPIFDNCDLEALSEAAAKRKRWEFLLTVAPIPVKGGTGSPVNPIATF